MFNWLLKRRVHKKIMGAKARERILEDGIVKDLIDACIENGVNLDNFEYPTFVTDLLIYGRSCIAYNPTTGECKHAPIRPLCLDREDHYTCVKCGHTHIVMKGE